MKQKDIGLILVVVFISVIVSLFASKAIFATPTSRKQKVEVVPTITADFPKPDTHYFNNNAFDPTRTITIGQDSTTDPFNGKTQ